MAPPPSPRLDALPPWYEAPAFAHSHVCSCKRMSCGARPPNQGRDFHPHTKGPFGRNTATPVPHGTWLGDGHALRALDTTWLDSRSSSQPPGKTWGLLRCTKHPKAHQNSSTRPFGHPQGRHCSTFYKWGGKRKHLEEEEHNFFPSFAHRQLLRCEMWSLPILAHINDYQCCCLQTHPIPS